ncbi:outer membrane protein assembly factor BamB family protein [Maribellus mangrovi]|uniref:outer membrane protein assembly factor BamB family protein n=1 Tax=Maribellus mangrovi TaxID=3133146 RepID=UPI0030ED6C92
MKRSLIIILATAVIAVIAVTIYFTRDKIAYSRETSLYKAIPVTAPVFVEFSSLKAVPADNPVLEQLSGIGGLNRALKKLEQITNDISSNKEIQKQWLKRPVILAFDLVGEDKLRPVFISKIKSAEELNGIQNLLMQLTNTSGVTPQERKYSGHKVFSYDLADGEKVHFCAAGGLIIISPESILLDKSIRQLNSENLTDIRNFMRVNKSVSSQSDMAWFINHQRLPELWNQVINGTTQTEVNEFGVTERHNLRRKAAELKDYAGWSELDMTFHDNHISLNGITAADDSLNHFVTIFKDQQAENFQADKALPRNTSFYFGFSFSDRDLFFQNLIDHFKHANTYYEREELLKKIEKNLGDESRTTFRNMVKNQAVAAITDISPENELSTLFVMNINSRKDGQKAFEEMMTRYASRKKVKVSSLYNSVKVENDKTYRVYQFPYPSLPGVWLGESFRFVKAKYAAFYDDYLVFASSEKSMKDYLSDMELNYTLSEDRAYDRFKRNTESKSNLNVYANVSRMLPLSKKLFNTDFNKAIETNSEVLNQFEAINWQLLSENGVYFNSINLALPDIESNDGDELWSCDLGADVSSKPQIVINHTNENEKEVIVQDEENRLHLVSADGNIIWSIPISGKILSEIHQMDMFRNGKLQYLFNTSEKLYLIDRNGNNVGNFPVTFESAATNGVSVFDYDNNHTYRYFVACENRKVYAFDQEGKIINGWLFEKTKSKVTTPVQHFRVNNRDYIVLKDESKIFIQNRRGATRVPVTTEFQNSRSPLVLNMNGTPKIVASDLAGKVYYLYFDGKVEEKPGGGFSASHYFTVEDLDGNNIPDFVFADGNQLEVADENGLTIYSEKLDNPVSGQPYIYTFSPREKMVGISDAEDNHIYLFKPDGKQVNGFPLRGSSAFSIGELKPGLFCVLVGNNREELVCYGL